VVAGSIPVALADMVFSFSEKAAVAKKKSPEVCGTRNVVFTPHDVARLGHLLISPRRLCAEKGVDWKDVLVAVVDDKVQLIETARAAAQQLNEKHPGMNITWRDLV
jgi:hypothetical protein